MSRWRALRLPVRILAWVTVTALLAGCARFGPPPTTLRLTVFAASSLTAVFTDLGAAFETSHPHTNVVFSFGSSAALATQLRNGAPADVFAAADHDTMASVQEAGRVDDPMDFAANTLQIAVPAGNPAGITGLADFADPATTTVICAPQVPCGASAARLFAGAGITPVPASYESDVKAALAKVTPPRPGAAAEADAALVYRSDVVATGGLVEGIEVPGADQVVNTYSIAVTHDSAHRDAAAEFAAFVRSVEAQRVLAAAGFRDR